MIHTVKGFSVVNEAEIDFFFFKFPSFLHDPMDVGNLISGSSASSKSILIIWKFLVNGPSKPSLEDFKHYFSSIEIIAIAQ